MTRPNGKDEVGLTRRDFFQLVGASLALQVGCHPPPEAIYEYTRQPVELTPGVPLHYATTMTLGGRGAGLVVASNEGRPTKVEGNAAHPGNLGAASAYEQASVRGLYDPDRARLFKHNGVPTSPRTFYEAISAAAVQSANDAGAGLALLLDPSSSPSLASLVGRIRNAFPRCRVYSYASLSAHQSVEGARLAFGRPLETIPIVQNADVILSLDGDFLALMPGALRDSRAFAGRRSPETGMNRLYVVENHLSATGQMADHRLRTRSHDVCEVAFSILKQLARSPGAAERALTPLASQLAAFQSSWEQVPFIVACARDLAAHPGRALVIAGPRQPAIVHAAAHAMNAALQCEGVTVSHCEPLLSDVNTGPESLAALTAEMNAGQVHTLLIGAWNPVYCAPADIDFGAALSRVPARFYLGPYEDETFKEVNWFAPAAHYLESWGDERAVDGTVSLSQPLIAPLFGGITVAEMLASLLPPPDAQPINAPLLRQLPGGAGFANPQTPTPPATPLEGPSPIEQQPYVPLEYANERNPGAYELLRTFWISQRSGADFNAFWERSLQSGIVDGTAAPRVIAPLSFSTLLPALSTELHNRVHSRELEFNVYQDARVYDGRFANNPWLQEFPDPMTKLTWDNAALVSPRTAKALNVLTGDLVELGFNGRQLRAAILVAEGHADQSVSMTLGYGRLGEESVAAGLGFKAEALRTKDAFWFGSGLSVHKVHGSYSLALEQEQSYMESRPIAIETTLAEFEKRPSLMDAFKEEQPSIWSQVEYTGHKWGMGIDLNRCVGCGACVTACVAENNVPPVGKEQVSKGRIMIWLRLDRYFTARRDHKTGEKTDTENPGAIVQPLFCVHCQDAPCEYVCPVNATVHSDEGLNLMVYNRCIGTRYCSNNCPYKVRRFNYLVYNDKREQEPLVQMGKNPDVSIRSRGVMEKCTYCVQRIERARIDRRRNFQELREGDIVTACQQTCPTEALVFGDLNDPNSRASRMHKDPRSYLLLSHLNTRPRSAHMLRLKNENPELL